MKTSSKIKRIWQKSYPDFKLPFAANKFVLEENYYKDTWPLTYRLTNIL